MFLNNDIFRGSSYRHSGLHPSMYDEEETIDGSIQQLIESLRESGLAEEEIDAFNLSGRRRSSNRRPQMDDPDILLPPHSRITRQPLPPSRRSLSSSTPNSVSFYYYYHYYHYLLYLFLILLLESRSTF